MLVRTAVYSVLGLWHDIILVSPSSGGESKVEVVEIAEPQVA